ncbi:MAG: peptide chain release factor family protein [Planctomycetota bacterium]
MQAEPDSRSYLALDDKHLLAQCEETHYRASGPGGQKRNKTSSAVRLKHTPTGLTVGASDDRSQSVNKTRAIRRLRSLLAFELRGDIDPESYHPSALLRQHLDQAGRFRISKKNEHYFLVVSEVLDVLAVCTMRLSEAAALLDTSTSHLVKFFEHDVALWERVNRMRAAAGLKPLRSG